eukprot:TRINITY_DN74489_c0_g1_i1.p1 TRINITY_DN74489_c0_g1~~TRINITY_DN74489_c0_g1_i1.p1  ORF type:complete len:522 (-),score=119.70 TRINITY_DN74489_c0_g1_i1:186-1625(-)
MVEGNAGYKTDSVPAMPQDAEEPADMADGDDESQGGEAPPELLDLIDAAEEAKEDAQALAAVIRNIGRRIRMTPDDRDMLSDFEGLTQICAALAEPPHSWTGEAMVAFCNIMPDVCRQSLVNRATLRDGGFVSAAVELLRGGLASKEEATLTAACKAISSTCTANDGNKQAAAQLFPPGEGEETEEVKGPGALLLLLEVLENFPESITLQTEAIAAFRSLIVDDDTRKAECTPSAIENREVVLADAVYPLLREAVRRAFSAAEDKKGAKSDRLNEQALLLLREIARGQDKIQDLSKPSFKLISRSQAFVESQDARLVRAALAALRACAFFEDVRDELALSCETKKYILAMRRHMSTPVVCEQAFGLIAMLLNKNPSMASFLNNSDHEIISLGQMVLNKYPDRPDVSKSVVQTLWSVSRQNEKALLEVKELELFPLLRNLAGDHKDDPKWKGAVDATMNFLREYRQDQGLERKAVYNDYY